MLSELNIKIATYYAAHGLQKSVEKFGLTNHTILYHAKRARDAVKPQGRSRQARSETKSALSRLTQNLPAVIADKPTKSFATKVKGDFKISEDVGLFVYQKNESLLIRGERFEKDGRNYLNLREWYRNSAGEFAPSKKGFTMLWELAPEFIAAMGEWAKTF